MQWARGLTVADQPCFPQSLVILSVLKINLQELLKDLQ